MRSTLDSKPPTGVVSKGNGHKLLFTSTINLFSPNRKKMGNTVKATTTIGEGMVRMRNRKMSMKT